MKKAITTIGLFSMMMILTSFTTPSEIGGTQSAPRQGKLDPPTQPYQGSIISEIGGTQSAPRQGKLDPPARP